MKHLLLICLSLYLGNLCAQSINTEFGKNRVQYTDNFKDWDKYETENFVTYWYGKGRKLGRHVVQYAELQHDAIQDIMEHKMNDKIQIILYVDITDFKQSNIGNEEIFGSTTGRTKIVGNKMFVYFDGNHEHLRKQIRQGIARVYLNAMLYGNNIQEIVQNAVFHTLPEWFKEGIIQYASIPWDEQLDDELRDIAYQYGDKFEFDRIAERYPRIAGHAMWYYIDQNYGRLAIANLLYLSKIDSDLDQAVGYVLNITEEQLMSDWQKYWAGRYKQEQAFWSEHEASQEIKLSKKDHVPVSAMAFNVDGSYMLYVHNQQGKYKIVLRDMQSGDERTVMKYGHKNTMQATDYAYPVIDWHQSPNEFSFVYEHRDKAYLRRYVIAEELEYQEQLIPEQIWRVFSLDHMQGERYLMSANMGGYSDLIQYDAKLREPIPMWEDLYDDLQASVSYDPDGILFVSNRPVEIDIAADQDTILPDGYLTVQLWDEQREASQILMQTQEYLSDIAQSSFGFYFLSDETGMRNLYHWDISNQSKKQLTNLNRNIINYAVFPDGSYAWIQYYHDGEYKVVKVDLLAPVDVQNTIWKDEQIELAAQEDMPMVLAPEEDEELKEGYFFQSQFDDPEQLQEITTQEKLNPFNLNTKSGEKGDRALADWNTARIVAGRKHFRVDNFVTKFDNSVLFEGLEIYNNPGSRANLAQYGIQDNPNELQNAPNGLLLQATLKDLFEDHVIVGGVRIPLNLKGSEYFLIYEDRKKLIDKKYSLYRRSYSNTYQGTSNFYKSKTHIWYAEAQYKYPFDIYRSIRLRPNFRVDRFRILTQDNESLDSPVNDNKRLGLKLEYVYDNTWARSTNVLNGTSYKIYAEAYNRFKFKLIDGAEFKASEGFTSVVGADFRHYWPVMRHSVLAARVAGAASFGSEKVLYYLGGMEGAILQRFNDDTPFPSSDDFAFRTAAYQMRGFKSNTRNGASFAVLNAEFRFSIFKHLLGPNRGNPLFREMQIVGFLDAGTAWHGSSPWSDDNPLNTVSVIAQDVIQLEVQYYRNPWVIGYGTGIRTSLFGYLVKMDLGWGLENGVVGKPRLHIGFGADF